MNFCPLSRNFFRAVKIPPGNLWIRELGFKEEFHIYVNGLCLADVHIIRDKSELRMNEPTPNCKHTVNSVQLRPRSASASNSCFSS